MATLTLNTSFGDDWPPDAFEGGTITNRSATAMTYTSATGYKITLRGTDFVYDAEGLPGGGGTITGATVAKGGTIYATYTDATMDFNRAGMWIFGYDRDHGNHQNPDPFSFILAMMVGNDVVNGTDGYDDIRGGKGDDIINAGGSDDYVGDDAGNDTMNGGDGYDALSYEDANYATDAFRGVNLDALTGIALDCYGFTDHFSGFERYKDSSFSDTLKGSNINDESFNISRGNDVVDGRGGFDLVDYSQAYRWGAHRGITVNLATGVATDSWKGTDTLANIEGVIGTAFDDTLIGSGRDEEFEGGAGKDSFAMGGGNDKLNFRHVGDNGDGGHGIVIDFNVTKIVVDDGYGNTEMATGVDLINGSRFGDSMTGNGKLNSLFGVDGNDTINGGGGEDYLFGEWGSDRIIGGTGNDHVNGGGSNDTLTGGTGSDDFQFNWSLADGGVDTITDFSHGTDEIWITSDWGGGLSNVDLTATQFRSGAGITTASTAAQRVIYNTTTGDLYYDADGVNGAAAVRFATLSNHAALSFDDIHVYL